MGVVTPNNYDNTTHLYWFRKVERHPDTGAQSLAEAFCEQVSSWLGMEPPAVFWFEEAEFREASQTWLQNPSKHNQSADPLREPCEYFRWRGRPGWEFFGYTHRESPRGVLINIRRSGADLLDTIAEECFHLNQDAVHGAGWRATASHATVEREGQGIRPFSGQRYSGLSCGLEGGIATRQGKPETTLILARRLGTTRERRVRNGMERGPRRAISSLFSADERGRIDAMATEDSGSIFERVYNGMSALCSEGTPSQRLEWVITTVSPLRTDEFPEAMRDDFIRSAARLWNLVCEAVTYW
jgi:hypothetical protein